MFVLKLIDKSETKFTLEFYWLGANASFDCVRVTDVPAFTAGLEVAVRRIKLLDRETNEKVRTGDKITITTPDPASYPHHSWELLEMLWHLHRMVALSGAGAKDDDTDDDDDSFGGAAGHRRRSV